MEIKLRYTWRRKSDGQIEQAIYTIEEIENDEPIYYYPDKWELIARDLWTGLKDSKGAEIYGGDVFDRDFDDDYYGFVKYNDKTGEWCIDWGNRENDSFSNYHIDGFVVIGNIHTHPELITKQGE